MKHTFLTLFTMVCLIPDLSTAQKNCVYIDRGDATLYYEVSGEGKPVVILHGGLGNINAYSALVDSLKTKYKVIAVSTRGHNKSTLGSHPYSFGVLADDVIAILDNEKENTASIIGFSDGAVTAYDLAAYYPHRVNRIIALAGVFGLSDYTPDGLEWIKTISAPKMLESSAPAEEIQQLDSLIERMRPMWLEKVYISEEKAASIHVPTFIIGGDRDFFYSKEAFQRAHRIIPGSRLSILPGTGHNLRSPEIIHRLILPFLLAE